MGVNLSRSMAINRRLNGWILRAKTCHECAWEDGDACPKQHLPSEKPVCQYCRRNPRVKRGPGQYVDYFTPIQKAVDELVEAKLAIARDLMC